MAELSDLADAADAWRGAGRQIALATVVSAQGSVYRGVGAKMLFSPAESEIHGTLSGGCLEGDLMVAAERALAGHEVVRVHYDLSEEEMWTLGLGCGGNLIVQVEPLFGEGLPDRIALWRSVEAEEAWAAAVASAQGAPRLLVVRQDGRVEGTLGDLSRDRATVDAVRARLPLGAPGPVPEGGDTGAEPFADVLGPPPPLWLFGAGHDSIPVARLASRVGFAVTVLDPRPAYAKPERFPGVRAVLRVWPEDLEGQRIPEEAFCLILQHHMERDAQILGALLRRKVRYIGVLGPRGRTARLLARAAEGGADVSGAWERIHSPLGLDLGASGPEEIAVAVIGELVAIRHGRNGGPLNGEAGPLHGGMSA